MPYVSKAQNRFFWSAESRGELPEGTARRWAHETPDIKKLPERKKCKSKQAQELESLLAAYRQTQLQQQQKVAGMFDNIGGLVSDTSNALWGKNDLSRLGSWNRIKGYLPPSLSNHIQKNHVDPKIYKGVRDYALTGLGTAGAGLLGLYWLYNSLKKPKKPPREPERDENIYTPPSLIRTNMSVNERLGYDAFGRPTNR